MSLRLAAAALAIGLGVSGCAHQAPISSDELDACLNASDLSDAAVIEHCGNALEVTDLPKEIRGKALSIRGRAYELMDDCEHAVVDLTEAISLTPDAAPPYVARGRCYQQQEELEMALSNFHRAVARDPNYAEAYVARGWLFLQTIETQLALEDFANAIRLRPGAAEGYDGMGVAQAQNGDYEAALGSLNHAIRLSPEDARLYANRSQVQLLRGEWRAAADDGSKAIGLKPGDVAYYANRAAAYFVGGEYRRASLDMGHVAHSAPGEPYPYLWLYMAAWRLDKTPDPGLLSVKSSTEAWPTVVLRYYQGKKREQDVVAATMMASPSVVRTRKCEADVFLAMRDRADGRRDAARQRLEHARDTCALDEVMRAVAIAELPRL